MNRRALLIAGLCTLSLTLVTTLVMALSEAEPNDTPAEANELKPVLEMSGAIEPVPDVDYYWLEGVNVTWGFIALLQTDQSTASQSATLTALGNDGTTVLQEDSGSWQHGSGIALQNFADGSAHHYLRVNEDGDDAPVTTYTLRLYRTIVRTQPEVEPNDTRASGTPSSFTHEGTLSAPNDRDCFAFHGRAGDLILLAVDGDPEGDGSVADPVLELVDPSDVVLACADFTGLGGKEFLEYSTPLPAEGVYAYCVSSLTGGPGATYRAGIVRNGGLYKPAYEQGPTWLNPPPGKMALVGDTLSFRVAITNTSPLALPGEIRIYGRFPDACLDYAGANPAPTNVEPDQVTWVHTTGLAPGAVFSATVDLLAVDTCSDDMHQSTVIDYIFTGAGGDAPFSIGRPIFLPAIRR